MWQILKRQKNLQEALDDISKKYKSHSMEIAELGSIGQWEHKHGILIIFAEVVFLNSFSVHVKSFYPDDI